MCICLYIYVYIYICIYRGEVRVRMGRAEIVPGGQLKLVGPNPDCVKDDCSNHDGHGN